MARNRRRQRGVSLIEAVVALAVMAFGTMAVLGVQTTLRMNGDIAKQRNEAIRIANETLEISRAFNTLAEYEALGNSGPTPVEGYAVANATYEVTRTVLDDEASAADLAPALPLRRKGVVVTVRWADRTGQDQQVRLFSSVHGVEPALAGSLSIPADKAFTRGPGRRHVTIPPAAVDQGDGTSRFDPPGAGGAGWIFSNATGYIIRTCSGVDIETCLPYQARLLAGFVSFATEAGVEPSGIESQNPPSLPEPLEVELVQIAPAAVAGTVQCYEETVLNSVAYYCAVPIDLDSSWSGQSRLVLPAAAAFDAGEPVSAARRRVCRYTPVREHLVAPSQIRNEDHPLHYVAVAKSLVQQNFLVIRAGDGVTAYDCPPDGPATFRNTNTWRHQPES